MNDLTRQLKSFLQNNEAALIGFADLGAIRQSPLPYGVAVAVPLPVDIIKSIHDRPNIDYYHTYYNLNNTLDKLVTLGPGSLKHTAMMPSPRLWTLWLRWKITGRCFHTRQLLPGQDSGGLEKARFL